MEHRKLKIFIASGLWTGYIPWVPGSAAAALGVLIHWIVFKITRDPMNIMATISLMGLVLIALTNYLYDFAEEEWRNHDASEFVLDEIIGYFNTVCLVLIFNRDIDQIVLMFWGFILFRLFDIIKVPPANLVDKYINGPVGVIGDDLISSVYAAIVILLIF